MHKFTTCIADRYAMVAIGQLNLSFMTQTNHAKSAYDAGLGMVKALLRYKVIARSAWFFEVNESYTTQTCSCCGNRSGPKGRPGLGIRVWSCHACGITHDRDVNAARNILALGHERLAVGIPAL